jgi:hypothetical protein
MPKINVVKIYKASVISFTILISISIIPSLLPHPRYIALCLLLGSILLSFRNKTKFNIGQSIEFKIVMLAWLVFYVLSSTANLLTSDVDELALLSIIGQFLIFIFLFILLNEYCDLYGFQKLLRLYVTVCFLIAVPGVISWTLITFGLVEPTVWFVNIGELAPGRFPMRAFDFHVAPYYLSLVQYHESAKFTLFNIPLQLYRLSGISSESQYAALLVAPSLFLVLPAFQNSRLLKMIILICISAFVICTLSFTAYLIMFTLLLLYFIKTNNFKLIFLWLVSLLFLYYFYIITSGTSSFGTDLFLHKIGSIELPPGAKPLIEGIFKTNTIIVPSFGKSDYAGFFQYLYFFLMLACVMFFSLRLIFSNRQYWQVGFSVLYISIHFLKGMGPHITFWPFFLFFVSLLGYAYRDQTTNSMFQQNMINASS